MEQRLGKRQHLCHTSDAACHHGSEALAGEETTRQLLRSATDGPTVLELQLSHRQTHKGDLLFCPVEQGQMQVRSTDGQRYTGHASPGAQIEHPGGVRYHLTLEEVQ